MTFELEDGNMITEDELEEIWELDFGDDGPPIDHIEVLREVNVKLCDCAKVAKTRNGRFIVYWTERHPEIGTREEYFPKDCFIEGLMLKPEPRREWAELKQRMPSSCYCEEISRQLAYQCIAYFFLPDEFHSDAGLIGLD